VFEISALAFPWEGSKVRQVLSHRLAQLISYLHTREVISPDSITADDKSVKAVQSPFTHLPENKFLHYVTAFFKVLFSMFLCVLGVILLMSIYGIIVINVMDSRLFLEVTFGGIDKKELIGGSSVIGIAIGYAVGGVLSIYFALCEAFGFLNGRILSFGIFYALLMSFFIIAEEAVIATSLIALSVPFVAYAFYNIGWSMRAVYLKGDE